MLGFITGPLSKILIGHLTKTSDSRAKPTTNTLEELTAAIKPGDVLLVEGSQRFSTWIKYLTQSNWSHAAIFIGTYEGQENMLLEADLEKGVITLPLSTYAKNHTRICRPINLTKEDRQTVINYCLSKLGHTYDLKNIFDLAKYLTPIFPIPTRFKRSLLRFGSGDPSKVICSSLIADGFQLVHYPIIPMVYEGKKYEKLHASFYVPSDFDRSPYFDVIKPTIARGFDYKKIDWTHKK